MNIGSLYRVKKGYWMFLSRKESASALADAVGAAYYSQEFKENKENVTYFSPESYIVFLEEDGKFKKVLTSEGLIGWTWFTVHFNDYFNDYFEEVKQ